MLTPQIFRALDETFSLYLHEDGELNDGTQNLQLYSHEHESFVPMEGVFGPLMHMIQGGVPQEDVDMFVTIITDWLNQRMNLKIDTSINEHEQKEKINPPLERFDVIRVVDVDKDSEYEKQDNITDSTGNKQTRNVTRGELHGGDTFPIPMGLYMVLGNYGKDDSTGLPGYWSLVPIKDDFDGSRAIGIGDLDEGMPIMTNKDTWLMVKKHTYKENINEHDWKDEILRHEEGMPENIKKYNKETQRLDGMKVSIPLQINFKPNTYTATGVPIRVKVHYPIEADVYFFIKYPTVLEGLGSIKDERYFSEVESEESEIFLNYSLVYDGVESGSELEEFILDTYDKFQLPDDRQDFEGILNSGYKTTINEVLLKKYFKLYGIDKSELREILVRDPQFGISPWKRTPPEDALGNPLKESIYEILREALNDLVYRDEPKDKHKKRMSKDLGDLQGFPLEGYRNMPPPENESETTEEEIEHLDSLIVDRSFIEHADDIDKPFEDFLSSKGLEFPLEEIKKIMPGVRAIILRLKYYYNRPRPWQIARRSR